MSDFCLGWGGVQVSGELRAEAVGTLWSLAVEIRQLVWYSRKKAAFFFFFFKA